MFRILNALVAMVEEFYDTMDAPTALLIVVVFSIGPVSHLVLSIKHLYQLGKNNSRLKKNSKIKKAGCRWERISLKFHVEHCQYHTRAAKYLRWIYLIYLLLLGFCVVLGLLCMWIPALLSPTVLLLKIKNLLLDLPLVFHFMVMTKYDRRPGHGGITYRWDTN